MGVFISGGVERGNPDGLNRAPSPEGPPIQADRFRADDQARSGRESTNRADHGRENRRKKTTIS